MCSFHSHCWTPPGWTHDIWNYVFLQHKLQILSTQRPALRNADQEIFPLGYVCESSALLIHHKVYAVFQSHMEII